MEWLLVLAVAIALGFAVVLWRLWGPGVDEELDEASRIPLREDDD